MVVGTTNWLLNLYRIKKLRLEIKMLQRKAEKEDVSPIVTATLEELEEYSRKTDDPKRVKRMMRERAGELLRNSERKGVDVGDPEIQVAIAILDRSHSIEFRDIVFPFVANAIMLALVLPISFLAEWVEKSNSLVAEIIRLVFQLFVFAILAATIVFLSYQAIVWLHEKYFSKD